LFTEETVRINVGFLLRFYLWNISNSYSVNYFFNFVSSSSCSYYL